MTTILALDLSKRSTGFALWGDSMAKPVSGIWSLGYHVNHGRAR